MSVPLHLHTTFSKLDGFGFPSDIVKRVVELGMTAVAVTDHGNTSAHPKLEKACKKHGIKPIYGVELYLDTQNQKKQHITVLAKNAEGYKNLLTLASLAYEDGYYYYRPCVDLQDVYKYQKGLIVLSGCISGYPARAILNGLPGEAALTLLEMKENIEDFYVEIQPLVFPDARKVTDKLAELVKTYNLKPVLTNDTHFILPEHRDLQHFLYMTRVKTNLKDSPDFMSERCCIVNGDDYSKWIEEDGYSSEVKDVLYQGLMNQDVIAETVEEFDLPKSKMIAYNSDSYEERYSLLKQRCNEGWFERGINEYDQEGKELRKKQGKYELELIKDKGYVDYFLVVQDMVEWSKENNILIGPGRGSVAASLVSYLLKISEVEPLKYEMVFERFLNPSRNDPPDIDLDFQKNRREEVKAYLKGKWGDEYVADVAGYTLYHPKSLIDDIGRNYRINKFKIKEYKNMLKENGGKLSTDEVVQQIIQDYPNNGIPPNITQILGQLRGFTVHAAGVIVSSVPLKYITTMQGNSIALDKKDAEYLDLLKIDVLSLKFLEIIGLILDKIGMTVKELYNMKFEHKEVFQLFQSGDLSGIFQYSGETTKKVCTDALKDYDMSNFDNYDELFQVITDVNTLSRPASLNNGSTARYVQNIKEEVHPVIAKHTEKTRGQIIYQEQIMKVLREAEISWKDVLKVRKIIQGKGDPNELPRIQNQFIENLMKDGTTKAEGEAAWDRVGDEGAYGFNIPHSVCYTALGYYTGYFKAFHPLVFYWAHLVAEPDNEEIIKDAMRHGITILPARYGKSKETWEIEDGKLRAGWVTVPGIGDKTAESIVKKMQEGVKPEKLPKGMRSKLQAACAFEPDPEEPDYLGLKEMARVMDTIRPDRDKIADVKNGDLPMFLAKVSEFHIKDLIEYYENNGKPLETLKDKDKNLYVNMKIYDETGEMVATIDRYRFERFKEEIENIKEGEEIYLVMGRYSGQKNKLYITNFQRKLHWG